MRAPDATRSANFAAGMGFALVTTVGVLEVAVVKSFRDFRNGALLGRWEMPALSLQSGAKDGVIGRRACG